MLHAHEDLSHLTTSSNIRHNLDDLVVARHLFDQLNRIEKRRVELKNYEQAVLDNYNLALSLGISQSWRCTPPGPGYVDEMAARWVEQEKAHFAAAHVVETRGDDIGFYLCYKESSDDLTSATGPFSSLQAARLWFFKGGR
jgi:hypothetical protein